MLDYKAILHTFIDDFVDDKDAILMRELPNDDPKDFTLLIVAKGEDTSRLIGRKGVIADALREVLSIGAKMENMRIHLKFESFDTPSSEE